MAHLAGKQLVGFLGLLPASNVQEYSQHYAADNPGIASLAACRYPADFLIDHDTKINLVRTANASRSIESSNPIPVSRVDFAGQLVECHGVTEWHRPQVERPLIHGEAVSVYIPGPERNATGFQCPQDLLGRPSLQ